MKINRSENNPGSNVKRIERIPEVDNKSQERSGDKNTLFELDTIDGIEARIRELESRISRLVIQKGGPETLNTLKDNITLLKTRKAELESHDI